MTTSANTPRMSWDEFSQHLPIVPKALREISLAVEATGLDKQLIELVKVRASQRNGCAFCVQYHLNLARRLGVAQDRLDQLATWHDSPLYSAPERAALAWAEALTGMAAQPVPDVAYAALQSHFAPSQVAALTAALAAIQAWNRIAGALVFTPPAAT